MEFKTLIDLVQTITRNKIKNIEVLGNPDQKGSLVESFYDAVAKGIITSDEMAAKYLYGHEDKKDPAYQRLKNRLIRQLANTSFFVDVNQPSYNNRLKAYFACYRDFAAAYVVLLRGSNKASICLFEQVLEQSIKYEFIELSSEITRHLRYITSRNLIDKKQHKIYVILHRQFEEKRRLEMLAQDYCEELVDYYSTQQSPNKEIQRLADKYFNELSPMLSSADTSRFYYYTYTIGIIKYFAINDCQSVLQLIDVSLPLLESRKNTNRSMILSIVLQKLACLTQLRIFENNPGEKLMNYCVSLATDGHINKIDTFRTYFYYLSYQHKYQQALYLFNQAVSCFEFSQVAGFSKDSWLLFGGYLHLLAAIGKLDPNQVEGIVGPYRYGRLVNEIKVVDKDREGMNIPLLLLPILYNLANGNTQEHIRSKEALEKYRQRYLDNEINHRSATFVNMLLALDKKTDNPVDAGKRIKKGLAALSQEQPQVIGQSFAIEIIPYEDLWAMLMEKLERKNNYSHH